MSNTNCNNPKCWAFDCSINCKHMSNTNEKAQSASIKDKIYDGVVKHAAKHGSVSCRSISLISMSKYSEHLERKVSELESDLAKSQEKCSKYEGALEQIEHNLMNLQPHIVQACYPRHGVFIDNYVDPCIELAEQALKPKQ